MGNKEETEEAFKNAAASVLETFTQAEGGYELFNKVFGRAANPYLEVLFNGPELRTFSYDFTFAPRNELEQEEVNLELDQSIIVNIN